MSMMTAMDLQAAMIAHLSWKSKLSDFFYGLEDLQIDDVADHTNCDFGKWLYPAGLKSLAGFPDVDALEQLHKEVHQSIRELAAMPQKKRSSLEGRQELTKFHEKCDQLVEMLERMEQQVKKKSA